MRKLSQYILEGSFGDMGWREVLVLAAVDKTTPDDRWIVDIQVVEFMPPAPGGVNILPMLTESAKNTYVQLIIEQQNEIKGGR